MDNIVKQNVEKKFKEFEFLIKDCKLCNGKGYIFNVEKDNNLVLSNKAKQCSCSVKVYFYSLYKNSNIPFEYYDLSIKDFLPKDDDGKKIKLEIGAVLENIKMFYESGYGLFFYGPSGTGKTMLAVEVLKKALRRDLTGYYEWFPEIIDAMMKKGYSADPKKEFYNNIFENCSVLVIDELGKEIQDAYNFKRQDISRILEINILKKRSNKTTILISNINSLEELEKQYGTYVSSVIRQKFRPINLIGADFRQKGGIDNFFNSIKKEGKNE